MKSSDILKEIKRIAKEVLPKDGQLILYGSRARKEATEDSDWDLLILLDKQEIEMKDRNEIAYPFVALSWDVGELISPVIYTKESWKKMSFTPFYKNVEEDGIVLA
ncbi:MAG: nucleotidyltransferase domain-containing protein [Bacteroidetes bacterium]|uniref:Nucleotidyltransferase domain-containing protein n=1 Tax=Candidatus Cryptobacteroides faecipullorum TaxID=2840764 RepID=A0A9D9I6Y1_9BACT|nr:nucleotidyltransferase domain-containing protein [Candidatus Cryptobacteroides faecipullorum]